MSKREITLALVLVGGLLMTALLFLRGDSTLDEWQARWTGAGERPDYALTYLGEGSFELIDLASEEVIDTYQAGLFTTTREEAASEAPPEKVEEEKTEQVAAVTAPPVDESDYEVVEMLVFPGDNAWKIQEKLTPGADILTLMREVRKVNGGKEMHPIFPGKTYKFLRAKAIAKEPEPVKPPVEEPKEPQAPAEPPVETTETGYVVSRSLVDETFVVLSDGLVTLVTAEDGTLVTTSHEVDTTGMSTATRVLTGILLKGDGSAKHVALDGTVGEVTVGTMAMSNDFIAAVQDNNIAVTDHNGTAEILVSRPVHQLIIHGGVLYGLVEGPSGEKMFTVFDWKSRRVTDYLTTDEPIERLQVASGDLYAVSPKSYYRLDPVKGEFRVEGTYDGTLVQPDRTHAANKSGKLSVENTSWKIEGETMTLYRTGN